MWLLCLREEKDVACTIGWTAGAPEEVRAKAGGGGDSLGAFSGGGEDIDATSRSGLDCVIWPGSYPRLLNMPTMAHVGDIRRGRPRQRRLCVPPLPFAFQVL
jgi:hypothetical protein